MVSGQAPPFGWYWSASRSRDSAPSAERDLRHLAGRAGMVRGQLAALLRLAEAAAAGREHDRAGLDDVRRRSARASRSSVRSSSASGDFGQD